MRFLIMLLVLVTGCAHVRARDGTLRLADDVDVRPLAAGVWLHVTYVDHRHGIATNGLLVETGASTVLIDAGWNDAQAARLFDFAATQLHRPISDVIITHAHRDRIGGAGEARHRGARVHALARTIALARQHGQIVPEVTERDSTRLDVGGVTLELIYPGPGHTDDNLTIYLPATRILYGGCFLKSNEASDLGNVADSNLAAWPASLRTLSAAVPAPAIVVPGHGPLGGDPIAHTAELLRAAQSSPH